MTGRRAVAILLLSALRMLSPVLNHLHELLAVSLSFQSDNWIFPRFPTVRLVKLYWSKITPFLRNLSTSRTYVYPASPKVSLSRYR